MKKIIAILTLLALLLCGCGEGTTASGDGNEKPNTSCTLSDCEEGDGNSVTEETGKSDSSSEYCFIIDPIDGTTNFIHNYRCSVISVGLLLDGEPYFGYMRGRYTQEELKYIVEEITEGDFRVDVLVPQGASPETFDPTPRQIMALDTWCDHRITPVVIFTMLFITFSLTRAANSSPRSAST